MSHQIYFPPQSFQSSHPAGLLEHSGRENGAGSWSKMEELPVVSRWSECEGRRQELEDAGCWSRSSRCIGKGTTGTDGSVITEHTHTHTHTRKSPWRKMTHEHTHMQTAANKYQAPTDWNMWMNTHTRTLTHWVHIKLGMRLNVTSNLL